VRLIHAQIRYNILHKELNCLLWISRSLVPTCCFITILKADNLDYKIPCRRYIFLFAAGVAAHQKAVYRVTDVLVYMKPCQWPACWHNPYSQITLPVWRGSRKINTHTHNSIIKHVIIMTCLWKLWTGGRYISSWYSIRSVHLSTREVGMGGHARNRISVSLAYEWKITIITA
jgi:hypothetical protein